MPHQAHKPDTYLATYCRMRGYTQQDVAWLLGLRTASQVARWERGERLPNLVHALLLGRIYGTPVETVFATLVASAEDALIRRKLQERCHCQLQTAPRPLRDHP